MINALFRSLFVFAVLGLLGLLMIPAVSDASSSTAIRSEQASDFVTNINLIRSSHGLPPLAVHPEMISAAADWTSEMVDRSHLSHSTSAQINATSPPTHTKAGENVGRGNSVSSLFAAFMASPAHRNNILDPAFTHVGVAIRRHPTSGRLYTTHRFAAVPASGSGPNPAPSPAAVPAPSPPTNGSVALPDAPLLTMPGIAAALPQPLVAAAPLPSLPAQTPLELRARERAGVNERGQRLIGAQPLSETRGSRRVSD